MTPAHAESDFFHIDLANLRRVYVFFAIDVRNRFVQILGTTAHPTRRLDGASGEGVHLEADDRTNTVRYLIRDRAGQFTDAFDAVFAAEGIKLLRSAPQCPRIDAYAERWVRSVIGDLRNPGVTRTECVKQKGV